MNDKKIRGGSRKSLKIDNTGTIIIGRDLVINETTVTSITVRFDSPLIIVVTIAVLCP